MNTKYAMIKYLYVLVLFLLPVLASAQGAVDVATTGEPIYKLTELSKEPEYPGGLNAFRKDIYRNLRLPELDQDLRASIFISFVVEKDGAMTDIKLIRDPGYGLGEEAARALKAVKTKWSPGLSGGNPVRTLFSLPITVVITGSSIPETTNPVTKE